MVCQPIRKDEATTMNSDTRFKLGVALLVLGLILPFSTFLVAGTEWPGAVKTVVNGILMLAFEILIFPAIALMGKENFDRVVGRLMGVPQGYTHMPRLLHASKYSGLLKMLKPAGSVSRSRYTIGLVLLLLPILLSWIISYVPSWLPEGNAGRVWINLGLDLIVVTSLFVLGGDFWDKLRALFYYDAKAIFPASAGSEVTRSSA
jgi:hypothetical protein